MDHGSGASVGKYGLKPRRLTGGELIPVGGMTAHSKGEKMTDTQTRLEDWRRKKKGHAQTRRGAMILGIATALGWVLFLFKMAQTSEMALRYSEAAQEDIGKWVLMLLVMTVVSIALFVMAGLAKKRVARAASDLTASLRQDLSGAEAGDRARIESQLRELGA